MDPVNDAGGDDSKNTLADMASAGAAGGKTGGKLTDLAKAGVGEEYLNGGKETLLNVFEIVSDKSKPFYSRIKPILKYAYNSAVSYVKNKISDYRQKINDYFNPLVIGGVMHMRRVSVELIPQLEHGNFKEDVKGVVLHRTAGSTGKSALQSFKSTGVGTHFLIEKDGTIRQTSPMDKKAWHVGGRTKIDNHNTIGIEVVGAYIKGQGWEPLTDEQVNSATWLVQNIINHFKLAKSGIYVHEDLAPKMTGEGQIIYDAIIDQIEQPNGAVHHNFPLKKE